MGSGAGNVPNKPLTILCFIGGTRRAFRPPGAGGDHVHCAVELRLVLYSHGISLRNVELYEFSTLVALWPAIL